MTAEANAKPHDGAMRELTVEELTLQADAMNHLAARIRRAVAWAIDHNPGTDVSQLDRVLTALDLVVHQTIEDIERLVEARRAVTVVDVDDIPF